MEHEYTFAYERKTSITKNEIFYRVIINAQHEFTVLKITKDK